MIPVINGNFLSFKKLGIVFIQNKPAKVSLKKKKKKEDNITERKVEKQTNGY